MSWSSRMARSLMMENFISDWSDNDDTITVYVGHKVISRGMLQSWLSENGRARVDYDTQFRNNSNHTMVIFFNQSLAFMFKMQFINQQNYKDFEY